MSAPETPPPHTRVRRHELPDVAYARMALVLRLGLVVSAVILLAGLAAFLLEHPSEMLTNLLSSNPIQQYLDPFQLARGLLAGHSQSLLTIGVVVLVLTPIFRVATGWYYFLQDGERAMAAVTFTVLVLLLLGLLVLGPLLR